MVDFNDSTDSELGAACNRLSAFTLPLPAGALVDPASGLRESDLVLIPRRLHATRYTTSGAGPIPDTAERPARASVPIAAKA